MYDTVTVAEIEQNLARYKEELVRVIEQYTCLVPQAVSWLTLSAHSGATAPGTSDEIEFHLDASGLAPGAYSATLCIESDDPETSLTQVPVTLSVTYISYLPVVFEAGE